jgi:hypothetical protein
MMADVCCCPLCNRAGESAGCRARNTPELANRFAKESFVTLGVMCRSFVGDQSFTHSSLIVTDAYDSIDLYRLRSFELKESRHLPVVRSVYDKRTSPSFWHISP